MSLGCAIHCTQYDSFLPCGSLHSALSHSDSAAAFLIIYGGLGHVYLRYCDLLSSNHNLVTDCLETLDDQLTMITFALMLATPVLFGRQQVVRGCSMKFSMRDEALRVLKPITRHNE